MVNILVKPKSSRDGIGPIKDGRLLVSVTAPPVDSKANKAVIALMAKQAGVAKSSVLIVSGEKSRRKTVRLENVDALKLKALFEGHE